MKTDDFDYLLPQEYIAQTPLEPRDHSRLMILRRDRDGIDHDYFFNIGKYLDPGDLLVVNKTRVIPARLFGRKLPGFGNVEILLLNKLSELNWECLVGGKGINPGTQIQIDNGPKAIIVSSPGGSQRIVSFYDPIEKFFISAGHIPLPPYIHNPDVDPERYQTVFNKIPGSAAAPTAGLHFTADLIEGLKKMSIEFAEITLHVGLDTFAPVKEANPAEHHIHTEWCELTQGTADQLNQAHSKGKRIIAVGTTSVRTLESATAHSSEGLIKPWTGNTNLFILPGFKFRCVNGIITNFHLPKSTLLMLVSAFIGREKILEAYEVAKRDNYRFYSFGDAMLLL